MRVSPTPEAAESRIVDSVRLAPAPEARRASAPLAAPDDGRNGLAQAHEQALRHLADRPFIQFHPALAERLGHKAALLAGLALYWTRHITLTQAQRNGWFWMTARQWTLATGLSTREQSTARALLVEHALLQESLMGQPATMHYRVDLTKLARWLGVTDENAVLSGSRDVLPSWFRGGIRFHKALADLTGNVACGLYLSYLLQMHRRALLVQPVTGELHVSQREVSTALCLGPKVQRNARERLRSAGLLRETGASIVVLNLPAIVACLQLQDASLLHPASRSGAVAQLQSLPHKAAEALCRVPKLEPSRQHEPAPLLRAGLNPQLGLFDCRPTSSCRAGEGQVAESAAQSLLATTLANACQLIVSASKRESAVNQIAGITRRASPERAADAQLQPLGTNRLATDWRLAPDCVEAAENAQLGGPFSAENAKLDLPKTQSHISSSSSNTTTTSGARGTLAAGGQTSDLRGRRLLSTDSLTKSAQMDCAADESGHGGEPLVFPDRLDAALLPGVRDVIAKAPPSDRQSLLDELDGQLRIHGKTIHNPAGWLIGLIRRQHSSQVVLALAHQVAAERLQRQHVRQLVERAESCRTGSSKALKPLPGTDPAAVDEARQRLRVLRAEFVAGQGRP